MHRQPMRALNERWQVWCGLQRFSVTDAMKAKPWLHCKLYVCSSSLLHVEFPPRWLKYQHIVATFPPTGLELLIICRTKGADQKLSKPLSLIFEMLSFRKFSKWRYKTFCSLQSRVRRKKKSITERCLSSIYIQNNQYMPRNTVCMMFTVWWCGGKITISNLVLFSCSMQS